MQNMKNLFVLGAVLALFLVVPLTIFVLHIRQENRSRAQKATVIYFNTRTSANSPILNVKPGETVTLDLNLDPGANFVSNIRYMFSYDAAILTPIPASYTYNKDVFPSDPRKANLEGPSFLPSGQVSGLITIGNNPSNAITETVKVASFSFIVTSDITKLQSPTTVSFLTGANQTTITSVDPQSTGSENVLSSALNAQIAFVLPAPASGQITSARVLTCPVFPTSCQVQVDWVTQNASNVSLTFNNGTKIPVSTSGSYANFFNMSGSLSVALYDGDTLLDQKPVASPPTPTVQPTNGPTLPPLPTLTPVPTSTPFPTNTPTPHVTITPTPTPFAEDFTQLNLDIALHGIGSSGDNRNSESSLSNKNPLTTTRPIVVSFYDPLTDAKISDKGGTITYASESGTFKGTIALLDFTPGQYTVSVQTDRYLIRSAATNVTIPANVATTITVPQMSLVAGDVNTDNRLSILDYNLLMDCYSDISPAKACGDTTQKSMSDLTDDSLVNQTDYNLFIRELSVQYGAQHLQ